MAKAASTYSSSAKRIGSDIEYDIIGTRRIARHTSDTGEMVEAEIVAHAPRDVVVGTRRIAANAHASGNHLAGTIKRQPSTEHINSADLVADHRVLRSTDVV